MKTSPFNDHIEKPHGGYDALNPNCTTLAEFKTKYGLDATEIAQMFGIDHRPGQNWIMLDDRDLTVFIPALDLVLTKLISENRIEGINSTLMQNREHEIERLQHKLDKRNAQYEAALERSMELSLWGRIVTMWRSFKGWAGYIRGE